MKAGLSAKIAKICRYTVCNAILYKERWLSRLYCFWV